MSKKVLILLITGAIILILLFTLFLIYGEGTVSYGYSYDRVYGYCTYYNVPNMIDEIIQTIEIDDCFHINEVYNGDGVNFTYYCDDIDIGNNSRIYTQMLYILDDRIEIRTWFYSFSPLEGNYTTDEEYYNIDAQINKQFDDDKIIFDTYVSNLNNYLNQTFDLQYDVYEIKGIDFDEKYNVWKVE